VNTKLTEATNARLAGKLRKAEKLIRLTLKKQPRDPETLHLAGLILRDLGNDRRALRYLEKAAEYSPQSAPILCDLGLLYKKLGEPDKAIAKQRRVCGFLPQSAPAWSNLGSALNAAGQYDEAIRALTRAIDINPSEPEFHFNLGNAYFGNGDLNPAISSYERTIELSPTHLGAHLNLASVQKSIGRIGDAELSLAAAAQIDPPNPNTLWNESLLLLMRQDFQSGWAAYEARCSIPGSAMHHQERRRWDGKFRTGQSLLIHAEQGLGDTIQFCRYLDQFAESRTDYFVELPERLVPLLSTLPTCDQHIAVGEKARFDVQIPLLSLPYQTGPTEPFWPDSGPYLSAERSRVDEWRTHLPTNKKYRIAICWQGNASYRADATRSIPIHEFTPVAGLPDIQLISLQQGEAAKQLVSQSWGSDVLSLGNEIDAEGAFLDSAAILENVDLLITSDTAIAHLGGALGVETWVVLSFVPDWRWGLDGTETPWYPTMKLYRQTQHGD
tara:strand:- start:67697 stop:69193 length:1497 start_codon:yes stop_codon:yes gene_type:complete